MKRLDKQNLKNILIFFVLIIIAFASAKFLGLFSILPGVDKVNETIWRGTNWPESSYKHQWTSSNGNTFGCEDSDFYYNPFMLSMGTNPCSDQFGGIISRTLFLPQNLKEDRQIGVNNVAYLTKKVHGDSLAQFGICDYPNENMVNIIDEGQNGVFSYRLITSSLDKKVSVYNSLGLYKEISIAGMADPRVCFRCAVNSYYGGGWSYCSLTFNMVTDELIIDAEEVNITTGEIPKEAIQEKTYVYGINPILLIEGGIIIILFIVILIFMIKNKK